MNRSGNFKSYLEWQNERDKIYYFPTHVFYSSDQYWANQLYTTEHATEAVTIVKTIQTLKIYFNNRCTLSLYQSGIEFSSFNI